MLKRLSTRPVLSLGMAHQASQYSTGRHQRFPSEEPSPANVSDRRHHRREKSSSPTVSRPLIRPSKAYLDLSSRTPQTLRDPGPKLLVLDLNGALIYRAKHSGGPGRRASYPRPYLSSFLEYLFAPERDGRPRPWEAFVWSSAQPVNVRNMVELGFGTRWTKGVWEPESYEEERERRERGEGRLLGVWARDKMGLTESQYHNKTQTTKDLTKVYEHFAPKVEPAGRWSPSAPMSPASSPPPAPYSELNSLLLDDSPLKAVYQPFNQLVIPEFDRQEHRDSIESLIAAQEGYETHCKVDSILLGVIGILEALRSVDNVPAWVRAGSLFPAAAGPARIAPIKGALKDVHLPSHADYLHWYASPPHLDWWIARGRDALKSKGIPVQHGVNLPPKTQPKAIAAASKHQPSAREVTPVENSKANHENGESSTGAGTRAGAFGIAGLAAISQEENEKEDLTPLPLAVHAATQTIRRVLSSLPPLQKGIVRALYDTCEILPALIPIDHVDPVSDEQWRAETERVRELGVEWTLRAATKIIPSNLASDRAVPPPPSKHKGKRSKVARPESEPNSRKRRSTIEQEAEATVSAAPSRQSERVSSRKSRRKT